MSKDIATLLETSTLPRYIAVEGPIGVGKTSLAKRLAHTFNYQTLLESAQENPFLERFYRNKKEAAFPTQLFFLFQRAQQLKDLRQQDLFHPVRVADFLIEKDQLFAQITLDDDELHLYNLIYEQMSIDTPTPDLVVYLQAAPEVLIERVRKRGIGMEQGIDADYLETLNQAYTYFFHHYDKAPLLIVNATTIDWVNKDEEYEHLLEYMLNIKSGRHYYNPTTPLLS